MQLNEIFAPNAVLTGLQAKSKSQVPVAFDAVDDKRVDLVVMLLVPENAGADHLRILAQLSRIARDHHRCATMRGCSSAKALWETLTAGDRQRAA